MIITCKKNEIIKIAEYFRGNVWKGESKYGFKACGICEKMSYSAVKGEWKYGICSYVKSNSFFKKIDKSNNNWLKKNWQLMNW